MAGRLLLLETVFTASTGITVRFTAVFCIIETKIELVQLVTNFRVFRQTKRSGVVLSLKIIYFHGVFFFFFLRSIIGILDHLLG